MIATRFAVATHILLLLATEENPGHATSVRMAESVDTNPVVIRRITGQLARAGLVQVRRGPGGAKLGRPANRISLRDVWRAVNIGTGRPLLPLHPSPDQDCRIGGKVHAVLTPAFDKAEAAMESSLDQITLDSLVDRLDGTVMELQSVREARRAP